MHCQNVFVAVRDQLPAGRERLQRRVLPHHVRLDVVAAPPARRRRSRR